MPIERELLRALPALLPQVKILRARRDPRAQAGSAELAVDILTPVRHRRRLIVSGQAAASPGRAREALLRLKARSAEGYPVFASTFLSPRLRAMCREEQVGYVDLAGNALLQLDDCYLEKVVERNPFPLRGRPSSLFTPVASRIARAMLEEPQRRWTVLELSEATGVSLGHVSNVTRRLLAESYLAKTRKRLALAAPALLLEAWQDRCDEPAGARQAYYSFEREPERIMQALARVGRERRWRYAVTSFAAASLVAPFIRGVSTVQWYVDDEAAASRWARALDLRPAEAGPNALITVPRDPGVFYRAHAVQGIALVGNVQLYLDLLREPGRGAEQAAFLRQHRLTF